MKKRKTKNKTTNVASDVTSGGETDAASNRRTQKQVNELKNIEPQKVFAVEVKNNVDVKCSEENWGTKNRPIDSYSKRRIDNH